MDRFGVELAACRGMRIAIGLAPRTRQSNKFCGRCRFFGRDRRRADASRVAGGAGGAWISAQICNRRVSQWGLAPSAERSVG